MPNYHRAWCPGGTYFFTVNLLQRSDNDLLVRHIDLLRDAVRTVRLAHPFKIHAWVVLPEHMHCVIELPAGDADFALRWRLIKIRFSKSLPDKEWRSATRLRRGERGIWQRRYWEHLIRDDADFAAQNINNLVWVTFTRSNPATDIDGIGSFTKDKHWGCKGPVIIDARKKPHHAPELVKDQATEDNIERIFGKGGSLQNI